MYFLLYFNRFAIGIKISLSVVISKYGNSNSIFSFTFIPDKKAEFNAFLIKRFLNDVICSIILIGDTLFPSYAYAYDLSTFNFKKRRSQLTFTLCVKITIDDILLYIF